MTPSAVKMHDRLRSITDFCPPGTQIRSPGGAYFKLSSIIAVVANEYDSDPELLIVLEHEMIKVRFHRNVDGGMANVYAIQRAIVLEQVRQSEAASAALAAFLEIASK